MAPSLIKDGDILLNTLHFLTIGVIISTYNNPAWLEKTLWGYLNQTRPADEILIADDGSTDETRKLIESFTEKSAASNQEKSAASNHGTLPIKHIWQEDRGFQKSQILNKALVAATAEYLIFTDQDCVPRKDFIATHERYAEKNYILSGGYFRLPMDISKQLTRSDVESGNAFSYKWLKAQGLKWNFKCTKLIQCPAFSKFMNFITPAKATWNGCNASGWRADMLAINGYNEEMHYGGQDREFGERLFNMGLKSKQIRYSAILLHLDHKRPYKTPETLQHNREIRNNTKLNHIIQTPNGINKLPGSTKSE